MESSNPTGDRLTTRDDSEELLRVQLREAQHRVRNDLQTVFSILRLVERRLGDKGIGVADVATWLNCLASVYDALPIWDQDGRLPVRVLLSVLRDRLGGPPLTIAEDDHSAIPGASGVAFAMALSCVLRCVALSGGVADVAIRASGGRLRVSVSTGEQRVALEECQTVTCRAALDALGGTLSQAREGNRTALVLEAPCR
jgi:hypothetical protein